MNKQKKTKKGLHSDVDIVLTRFCLPLDNLTLLFEIGSKLSQALGKWIREYERCK
jgi:hypothetical protein